MECRNLTKFFRVVIKPPKVEIMSTEEVRFEENWSKFCLASITSYFPAVGSLNVDCVVKKERILFYVKRF